jgi:hypothetical protein
VRTPHPSVRATKTSCTQENVSRRRRRRILTKKLQIIHRRRGRKEILGSIEGARKLDE